jgi:hypothetical protein
MKTIVFNNDTITLPDGNYNIDFTGVTSIRIKTIEKIHRTLFGDVPEYISDTIQDLKYGSVAVFVRENFTRVGAEHKIIAHSYGAVWGAFNNNGWKCKITKTGRYAWLAKRTV